MMGRRHLRDKIASMVKTSAEGKRRKIINRFFCRSNTESWVISWGVERGKGKRVLENGMRGYNVRYRESSARKKKMILQQ